MPGASLTVNHPRGNGWMGRFWARIPCDYRHCDRIRLPGQNQVPEAREHLGIRHP